MFSAKLIISPHCPKERCLRNKGVEMIDTNRVVNNIMARLPNAGTVAENEAAKQNVRAIAEEILAEITTNAQVSTTVTTTDSNGDAGTGTGTGTIS